MKVTPEPTATSRKPPTGLAAQLRIPIDPTCIRWGHRFDSSLGSFLERDGISAQELPAGLAAAGVPHSKWRELLQGIEEAVSWRRGPMELPWLLLCLGFIPGVLYLLLLHNPLHKSLERRLHAFCERYNETWGTDYGVHVHFGASPEFRRPPKDKVFFRMYIVQLACPGGDWPQLRHSATARFEDSALPACGEDGYAEALEAKSQACQEAAEWERLDAGWMLGNAPLNLGCAVCGDLLLCVAGLIVAVREVTSSSLWYYGPFILVFATVTGCLLFIMLLRYCVILFHEQPVKARVALGSTLMTVGGTTVAAFLLWAVQHITFVSTHGWAKIGDRHFSPHGEVVGLSPYVFSVLLLCQCLLVPVFALWVRAGRYIAAGHIDNAKKAIAVGMMPGLAAVCTVTAICLLPASGVAKSSIQFILVAGLGLYAAGNVGLFYWHLILRPRKDARSGVAADYVLYQERWRPLVANDSAGIEKLAELCAEVRASMLAAKASRLQSINSVAILFALAHEVNPVFQTLCGSVAAGHGTHYPATVKREERALEKAWRSYAGDMRRLTDLVRASIICETLADLAQIVARLRDSANACSIVSVKNRFTSDYNAWDSAGYRNVCLNLGLMASGGVFVCELQLELKEFHALKKADGHRRYVAYRNTLAC